MKYKRIIIILHKFAQVNKLKICPALNYQCIIYQGLTCSLFYIAANTMAIILPNLIIKLKTAIDGMGYCFFFFHIMNMNKGYRIFLIANLHA